ncbi:hypothetical protein AbraCBS73388_005999 [Aspergillus brasiliensis]|uniref:Uncharacterized protein n=1 Tax=Aspergillus brasiliensis TaxID=319629 RepID=A0A9W5YK90_9EURO|nr:hypothetical protein AbraCBS73388_005999 [Aspergillus brasiliensis]
MVRLIDRAYFADTPMDEIDPDLAAAVWTTTYATRTGDISQSCLSTVNTGDWGRALADGIER